MFKVSSDKCIYTKEPTDRMSYTNKMDKVYTRFAKGYDYFMIAFPLWKKWLKTVMPYVKGNRILEVSFGPGYLLSIYPKWLSVYALDYNKTMVDQARIKTKKCHQNIKFTHGNVEKMPYPDEFFDTIVNTMAFSGYPSGNIAMAEMLRVLKKDGVLLILDYDYPKDGNIFGYLMVRFIEKCGDIIKDIESISKANQTTCKRKVVGAFGSIQLFIIRKYLY